MKEENENSTIDAEKLLREKSWEQLTASELEAASALFADKAEYERMRSMVHQLRSSSGVTDEELIPSAHVRKNLLDAFDNEQKRRRVIWWNSLGFWFRDRLRLDIPAVRFAVAGVILVAGVLTVLRMINSGDTIPPGQVADIIPTQVADSSDAVVKSPQVVVEDGKTEPLASGNESPEQLTPLTKDSVPNAVSPTRPKRRPAKADVAKAPPVVVDTISQRLALGDGTDTVPVAVVVGATNPITCCGTAISLTAPAAATATYNWSPVSGTPTGVFTNNGTNVIVFGAQPVSRSLNADEEVISVFWSLR